MNKIYKNILIENETATMWKHFNAMTGTNWFL